MIFQFAHHLISVILLKVLGTNEYLCDDHDEYTEDECNDVVGCLHSTMYVLLIHVILNLDAAIHLSVVMMVTYVQSIAAMPKTGCDHIPYN
jgi:hypothetical protein